MRKIYRSARDKKIFGLCGGLAEAFHIDATVLRLLLVILAFFTGGTVVFIYLIACLIVPKEPRYDEHAFAKWDFREGAREPFSPFSHRPDLDEVMNDLEKKALRKELERLRAKLAKYEKGDVENGSFSEN